MDINARTRLAIGDAALERLGAARVLVAGLGGVGGAAAEALARSGVGRLVLVDKDVVEPSNLNRQVIATTLSIGQPKAQLMAQRVAQVAPGCRTLPREMFITPQNIAELLSPAPDYVLDAIDNMTAKLALAQFCYGAGIPIISVMSAGNKLDPAKFEVASIWDTSVCRISRVMRKELRARGVGDLRVVYSTEPPRQGDGRTPGSVSFVPPVAGMIAAGAVVRSIAGLG